MRPKPTAMPTAPVDQIAAAVDVPATVDLFFKIAPPPINPMPVIIPAMILA